jgi:hypothetical protein
MKPLYLLLPLWLVISSYAILCFFLGDHGLLVMQRLEIERERMEQNIDELSSINAALDARMKALQSDPELIALEARKLGWGLENEERIRIIGQKERREALSAGVFLEAARPEGLDDMTLKTIALSLSSLASLVFAGLRLRGRSKTPVNARACEGAGVSSEWCPPR